MTSKIYLQEGSALIKNAIELEQNHKYFESKIYYTNGIELLLKCLKATDPKSGRVTINNIKDSDLQKNLRSKIKDYIERAELIKSGYYEQIHIKEGMKGFGYRKIFGRFLEEGNVVSVVVEDPYIMSSHQDNYQETKFNNIKSDLINQGIMFNWSYSETLHDREIRFDSGWIIKIGRGLDYIRQTGYSFHGLGVHDYDFRPCAETTIDVIYNCPNKDC